MGRSNLDDFTFEVLPSTKGGFDIVAKKNISNDTVESAILSHLKNIGENGGFNINIEVLGFVCREIQSVEEKTVPNDIISGNDLCNEVLLLEEDFDKFFIVVLSKNCRARTLHCLNARFLNLNFTLMDVLNCTDTIMQFGKKSADDFATELKRIGILDVDKFPFFKSRVNKK